MTASSAPSLKDRLLAPILWSMGWAVLVGVTLWARPLMPIDETRYLAVAWEMWTRQDFLVPFLNGETYSHKPPLLFWLMNLGWGMFGVNDWWPRLVAPLFGLFSLFLTASLARALWPERPRVAKIAPFLLLGGGYWALFSTLTMFDLLLAFWTLVGLLGLVQAWRLGGFGGWVLLGVAIGFGILTKGPAMLLHVMPLALSAPWWMSDSERRQSWGSWYRGILAALLIGAAIALVWAVPAGIHGGTAYRNAIFWGQTAGRVAQSFAHARPWWWYLAVLPGLVLPWLIWPPLWRAALRLRGLGREATVRFCLAWFVPVFVAFSFISGKQLHYLLPIFPALALLGAFLVDRADDPASRWDQMPAALLAGLSGALVLAAPLYLGAHPDWIEGAPFAVGVVPLVAGLAIGRMRPSCLLRRVVLTAMVAPMLVVLAHLLAQPRLTQTYDLRSIAGYLGGLQEEGREVAILGKYPAQFQFLGRLKRPLVVLDTPLAAAAWAADHPSAKIVAYHDGRNFHKAVQPDFVEFFRSRLVAVWDGAAIVARPDLLDP